MEADGETRADGTAEGERAARRAFHLGLIAGWVPLGVPLVWYLALRHRRGPGARSRWARLLLPLASVDTLAAAGFLAFSAVVGFDAPRSAPGWIGAELSREPTGAACTVAEVAPGSPAERAGLRPGDAILRVEGVAADTPAELRAALGAAGEPSALAVRREGREIELTVVPAARPRMPLGLRERLPAEGPRGVPADVLVLDLALLGLLGVLWRASRARAPADRRVWALTLASFAALAFVPLAADAVLVRALGGWSPAVLLFAGLLAMWTCVLLGVLALRRPPWGRRVARTAGVGALYLLATLPRARGLALGAALLFLGGPPPEAVGILETFLAVRLDAAGTALLFVLVVVAAPLAEELLFRGLLQPALGRAFGAVPAVLVTSLAFALAHRGYGVAMLPILGVGLVLGWARERSGGLAAPMLLHAGFNAVGSLVLL